ncbi:uncharacterized protein LOC142984455 isoform X2 [Anticarsia gemmatalis]|uniref:uncharacterized protein LOC142984455 isoform X2 n=1 Tax=Anticarsia gemmatalis TaxID=129554 RepID=UPI003F75ABA4
MMFFSFWVLGLLARSSAVPTSDSKDGQGYKDQYCTDPRTMRKHAAYTEWADAYSCTRHRCQPGGRNLAIYTVGCKRVEAPESAIECEEVVEDTNMQFPFCCTRLRCLVVVRGEVWTRVLGQPWEVLPAAPWSHMYKMKKPPPSDTTFLPKTVDQGPVYELSEPEGEGTHEKPLHSGRKQATTDSPDCNEVVPRASSQKSSAPDIVIALSTGSESKEPRNSKTQSDNRRNLDNSSPGLGMLWEGGTPEEKKDTRHKRGRKISESSHFFAKEDETEHHDTDVQDLEDAPPSTEKPPESSDEKFFSDNPPKEKQTYKSSHHQSWTEIPPNQWNEHEDPDGRANANEPGTHQQESTEPEKVERKESKPNNLQALVDAIGTRMRDIENVVQRMSEKVHQTKSPQEFSAEKRAQSDSEYLKHQKTLKEIFKSKREHEEHEVERERPHANVEVEDRHKTRFPSKTRTSKFGPLESTAEPPSFVEDNGNNYFSDASNSVRRSNQPKEPAPIQPPTYMAPVEPHKPPPHTPPADTSEDLDKKKKKRTHKKRRNKTHVHKKHRSQEKRKHFNKLSSVEVDKTAMSMEDSSAVASK